jgi:glyoxylase-like metal-dependent hydrolase (beta-lactamase superfamily II)
MQRFQPAAVMALVAVCGVSVADAQTFAPSEPAARSFHVGAFEVTSLIDNLGVFKNDASVFGAYTPPSEVSKVLAAAGAPTDTLTFNVGALLVRTPGHVVLFDTGLGPSLHGMLIQSLAKAGVTPDQVSDIFITHSHFDHLGGVVDVAGKPAFPNAVIRMSANEWASLQAQAQSKALVTAIAPGQAVLPGITPIALYGHTPGHVVYQISSGGKTLVDIGDTAHNAVVSLARPDWPIAFDADKAQGAKQRRAELKTLADSHTLIFAPHFPFPSVGHVVAVGDGFAFKPEVE